MMNLQEEALFRVLNTGRMKNSAGEPIKSKPKLERTVIACEWPEPTEVRNEMERLARTELQGMTIQHWKKNG